MMVLPEWSGRERRNLRSWVGATSFMDSSTESSRSNDNVSASPFIAFTKSSGLEAGTKSLLRMGQSFDDGLREFPGARPALQVAGADIVHAQHLVDRIAHAFRLVLVADMVEHHRRGKHERQRIR